MYVHTYKHIYTYLVHNLVPLLLLIYIPFYKQKFFGASVFGCILLIGPYTEYISKRAGIIMNRQTFKQKREANDFPR